MTSRVWTRCLALQLGRVEARSLSHQFHSSGKLNARFPRASSTKEKQRNPGYDKRNDLAELREEDLPTGLFFQASRDGILPVDPSKAIDIARGCMMGIEAGRNPTAEVGQHICDFYKTDTAAIAGIAGVLLRSASHKELASFMLSFTSKLNEPTAAYYLACELLRHSRILNSASPALTHLRNIALLGKDPRAMILHGEVLERRGEKGGALRMYQKAMDITGPSNSKGEDLSMNGLIPSVWIAYGTLAAEMGNLKAARSALEKGAFEFDEPSAYYEVAERFTENKNSEEYRDYMMKAAQSGYHDASLRLGKYYIRRSIKLRIKSEKKGDNRVDCQRHNRDMAFEWLDVAANAGVGEAAVLIAVLAREDGQLEKGLDYLELARQDPRAKPNELAKLKEHWSNEAATVAIADYLWLTVKNPVPALGM